MVAGLVAISIGDELVIRHPAGHVQSAWIAVILGGPALFLAGWAIFEHAVFSRVSPDWVIGILVLAAISPDRSRWLSLWHNTRIVRSFRRSPRS